MPYYQGNIWCCIVKCCYRESDLISVYDGCMTFEVTRKHTNEHRVFAHCISSTLVGIDEKCEYLFMDINPLPEININDRHISVPEAVEKQHHMNQPTITDVFKQRKRKIFNQNDTIQSKEKRKRDMNLVDTFKSLKESLEKTAEEIKEDFTKKSDISQNLLQNLTKTNSPINKISSTTISHVRDDQYENQSLENAFTEDFDMEDIDIDDEQVKDILNEIENEIKDRKTNNSVTLETETKPSKHNQFSYFQKSNPVKYNYKKHAEPSKYMSMPANRRKLNTNNNYTFLDNLKKKDSNDYNIMTEAKDDTGFSETVQSQIKKYLQRAPDKLKIKNPIIVDGIDSSNIKVKDIHSRDSKKLTKVESESLQCCKDKTNSNDQIKSIVKYENKLQLNAEMDKFHDDPKDSIDLTIDESIETSKDETNNNDRISDWNSINSDENQLHLHDNPKDSIDLTIDESIETYKDEINYNDRISNRNSINSDENQLHLDSDKDQFHKTSDSSKSSILKSSINLLSSSNFVPRQYSEIIPCNEAINKIVKSTEHQENNLKEITLKDTYKDDLQKGQNKNRKYSVSTFLPKSNVAPFKFPISVNNDVQIIAQVNNQPIIVEKKLNLENTNTFHDQRDNNYSESNTFEMPTTEENIEKISTYSFGKTTTFNFHTQNSSKQRVQIISNIKVDLDFTEIVYKKDELSPNSNEMNTTKYNDNPKIVAMEAQCQTAISDNDYHNKVTMLQNSTNKRLKMSPCLTNGAKRNSAFVQIVKSNNDYMGRNSKTNTYENNLPLQNDDKFCDKYMIFSGDNKENKTSVMDGLQKHRNMQRQNDSVYETQKNYRGSCSSQNSNVIIAKSSRKYKITEADDGRKHSNQSLTRTVGKKDTVSQKALAQRDNLMETVTSKNDFKIQQISPNYNNSTETVVPHFNIRKKDNRPIRMLDLMFGHSNSTHDFSVNQDNDEIIAPRPEFCDNNTTNSSTLSNDFHNNKLSPENSDNQHLSGNLSEIEFKSDLSQEANMMSTTLDKVTNIESISDSNETISEVNNFHHNKDTMTSKDTSKYNAAVKNILQKYSNIFKRQKPVVSTNINCVTKINRCENSASSTKRTMVKNSRQYKIRDIDKIQIPLPQSLIVENHNTASQKFISQHNTVSQDRITQRNMTTEAAYVEPYEIQQSTQYDNKQILDYSVSESDINIDDDAVEEAFEILSPDAMLSPLYSANDDDINQAILNPKTLLECFDKADNDKTITSPLEFCDDSTYSPTYTTDNQNAEEIITQGSKDSHTQNDLETTNVSDNDSVVDLTPSKEVETWTLSQEDVKSGSFSFDNMSSFCRYPNSYTILHKNGVENKRESHKYAHYSNNSRHAKLSYFKFERKRVFKKI